MGTSQLEKQRGDMMGWKAVKRIIQINRMKKDEQKSSTDETMITEMDGVTASCLG